MPEATAPDWIFGCFMHFTFLGCEVQEHRSTKRAFYWYIALMYDWTIVGRGTGARRSRRGSEGP